MLRQVLTKQALVQCWYCLNHTNLLGSFDMRAETKQYTMCKPVYQSNTEMNFKIIDCILTKWFILANLAWIILNEC
jgi:hypothetical protein